MEPANIAVEKTCRRCGFVGDCSLFVKRLFRCKKCHAALSATYRSRNRPYYNNRNRDYLTKHPKRRLYKSACTSARRKGLEKNITLNDISVPNVCPYLGVELVLEREWNVKTRYGPSIDRIDSSKGYVKGNVQIISLQANKMKSDSTPEEIVQFAIGVLKKHAPQYLVESEEGLMNPKAAWKPVIVPDGAK